MNTELILKTADEIEAMPHGRTRTFDLAPIAGFNMAVTYAEEDCGTVCCIVGYLTKSHAFDMSTVAELLRISQGDAYKLCFPVTGEWEKITPAQAAATLRRLAATGEVSWES